MRLLIAHSSTFYTNSLHKQLQSDYDIQVCNDGISALHLLQKQLPEALILDLMLPFKDGLTILQEAPCKPSLVLGLTSVITPYIEQAAAISGIHYLLVSPTVHTVVSRLEDMAHSFGCRPSPRELRLISSHMQKLGLSPSLDGYKQLRVGIPMYHRDPRQTMLKELYPAIAATNGWVDPRKVEHSMRRAIQVAWKRRDNLVWSAYFTPNDNGDVPCPSNKEFICRLAELLDFA